MLTFFKRWSWQKTLSAALIALMALCVFFLLWSYSQGKFDSVESMQAYVSSFGAFAPVVLTVVQAGQVVVPILPGFLGCAVGAALFGPAGGFVCNYIGISVGSIIAYFLARKYGVSIVKSLFKEKTYQKWEAWIGRQKYFPLALFMAILLPLFPDDFFCYFAGLMQEQKGKIQMIVTFLAVLELMKTGELTVVQEHLFDDMLITSQL